MCVYQNGEISSLVLESLKKGKANVNNDEIEHINEQADHQDENDTKPSIVVHGRDFLASLSRVIQIND